MPNAVHQIEHKVPFAEHQIAFSEHLNKTPEKKTLVQRTERSTTTHGRNIDRTEWNTKPTEPIFGRTDLRKGVSEAKFDVEADFDVEKSKIGSKSAENHEKP